MLLNPAEIPLQGIHQVLKESGLRKPPSDPKDKESLRELLEENNIGLEACLDNLGSIMRGAETGATRLKAVETTLKLHGVLNGKDEASNGIQVNIIINDPDYVGINPILVPR